MTDTPITLTLLHSEPMLGPLSGRCGVDSYADIAGIQQASEATGVIIEWNEMSMFTASEEFNLVVTSGDISRYAVQCQYLLCRRTDQGL